MTASGTGSSRRFNVRENLSLSTLDRYGGRGWLEAHGAGGGGRWTTDLGVVAAGPEAPITTLGSNQRRL
jgi:hypothetical protein